jgi:hypothetical protein
MNAIHLVHDNQFIFALPLSGSRGQIFITFRMKKAHGLRPVGWKMQMLFPRRSVGTSFFNMFID